ncbi:MAG: peptide-methionine (S)-S-oxide reductase [Gemmatimonadales bacterium]|nr:MAG: peptide-methionine (S)-S-oxide reductase [Gemmatimonadales bacterium]
MIPEPRPANSDDSAPELRDATLGGGCFWCLEAVFQRLKGVAGATSGYAGGTWPHPSYTDVCSGRTGHAEVVQVRFDPRTLPYAELLRVFFTIHDPTTPNRQGADVGSQYRSIILHHDDEQRDTARRVMEEIEASGLWPRSLVTELEPLEEFTAAEPEHHDFYDRNRGAGYCRAVIDPKIARARQAFAHRIRE